MKAKVRFLGLDVHAETIAIAVAEPDGEVRSLGTILNRGESIRRLVKKLGPVEHLRRYSPSVGGRFQSGRYCTDITLRNNATRRSQERGIRSKTGMTPLLVGSPEWANSAGGAPADVRGECKPTVNRLCS